MRSTLSFMKNGLCLRQLEKYLAFKKKEEIRHYYASCGNYRETDRAFKIKDSTVRKIFKAGSPEKSKRHEGFKGGKAWKGNAILPIFG